MELCKKRTLKVIMVIAGLLLAGLIYTYGALHWGWWLPCIFNWITGLKCPGCGVSRMCLALLRLDLKGAFYWNPAALLCMPLLIFIVGSLCLGYIRTGSLKIKRSQEVLCWIMAGFFVLFGIFRNL